MRIILIGAPGSGKSTQAKLISKNFNIPHISTGDIFRKNISIGTSLGIKAEAYIKKGQLLPDSITISMIEDRLNEEDCKNGFILDGFPRSISQTVSLERILEKKGQHINRVIFLDVPEHIITERIKGRRVCTSCGSVFYSKFTPNKIDNNCDICQELLIQREDDNIDTIKNRVEVYNNSIQPILDYYSDGGPLLVVNGYGGIENIYNKVNKTLSVI
ncbi:adenylate kinase [Clostridium butyricum]|uniref:Adenylate kinase n=1 Tax=Clostridium butyricum TaxID=1492 RepID=A0A512TQZ1_CLOBU|nr:adenylate kinase [Clostridium butyricum]NOW25268.1 adenylate kinase [Clostridium butyricum]GEQ22646.1 adenylate kinase [Clostridium butyricum]